MASQRNNLVGTVCFVLILLGLQFFSERLQFDRQSILTGELWRLITGHFVHGNIQHLLLNAVAALIIYFGFFSKMRISELAICSLIFSAAISVTMLLGYPLIEWYNGLSGLLHGLVCYCCLRQVELGYRRYWVGLILVWVKVSIETFFPNWGVSVLAGDIKALTEAHLVGAFVGTASTVIYVVGKNYMRRLKKTPAPCIPLVVAAAGRKTVK